MEALMNLNECREHLTIKFNNVDHIIRLAGTIHEPYFCGKDVCMLLGYKDHKDALQRYVDPEQKLTLQELNNWGGAAPPQLLGIVNGSKLHYNEARLIFIDEPGLYELTMVSHAPFAKLFRKLVATTIIPSIRRYGSYQVNQQLEEVRAQLTIRDQTEAKLTEELRLKDEELNETKEYANLLKDIMVKDDPITKDEIIYISTSSTYAAKNIFKVGGVKSESHIRNRFSQYNGNRVAEDK